jgi:uncharacterized protein (DUF4415 family)
MRTHYDFSKMKARRNPYLKHLKQSVTIRLDRETVEYFKALAAKTGLPYQNLINLYLRDCATRGKELSMRWAAVNRRTSRLAKQSTGGGR